MTAVLTQETLGGLRVVKADEAAPYINILIYGESGIGKTYFAGSASDVSEMYPVILLDMEGGTLTLKERFPDVEVVRAKSWNDIQEVYNELYRMQHDYKTVVIDSLSEMQKFSMYNIMKALVKEDEERDPDVPGLREWGKNTEQIRKMVRAFRNLPMHTIFTALVTSDKDQRTGLRITRPLLSSKLATEVAAYVDVVAYMYRKEYQGKIVRLLLTEGTDTTIAKDRSGKLPSVMIDRTDMVAVHELITNEHTGTNTKEIVQDASS